ncbi:MAG: HEAT repeat domain-containing protein [Bryobacterales bacterium]|nr:HEAT repeat domain-containing protein [Bryobacterales bacterium]
MLLVFAGMAAAHAQSVRLEDWARLRTAAAPLLGWKVGIDARHLPQLTFWEAAAKADALGVGNIAVSSSQTLSPEIPKKVDCNLAPGEINAVKERLRLLNLKMPVYFADVGGAGQSGLRELFSFARELGVETIVTDPAPGSLEALERLATEFAVNVAFHGRADMKKALAAVEGRGPRLGVYADTDNALESLGLLKSRLLALNLRGSNPPGLAEFFGELARLEWKPSLITVDAGGRDPFEPLETALRPVIVERVSMISKTAAIRGPDRLSPQERQKVESSLPRQAPAKPKRPRRLLVMDLNVCYPGHRSIPHVNLGLELMGRNTGAYEAVFSNDLDNLKFPRIRQFDAVFLNNTVGMIFVDPEVREGLLRFVREGGGLAGIHGVSHASMDWPEFSEMIGAWRGVHREPTEQAVVRIDDPASPLTAAFQGKSFVYQDEFFRFPAGPYSRDKLRVLLSMDVGKTDMNQGRPCFQPCSRPDHDYGISWIRSYGKGRVFFATLGHAPTLFMTPPLAAYLLAGIQFILGDLDADTTPSAKLAGGKRARTAAELEPLLAKIARYQYGDDPEPATLLDELVTDSLGAPELRRAIEARLLQFLQSDATPAGKNAAFRELSLIGTDASVPVLAPLLERAETAEMARYALAAIPGEAAGEALRNSLSRAPSERIRLGMIASLGHRRDAGAVPALAALLSSSNRETAAAAAAALAGIADRRSLDALGSAVKSGGPAREAIAEAYLACADRLAEGGDKAAAARAYRQMTGAAEPAMIRTRALTGVAAVEGRNAVPVLRSELASGDLERQAVALGLLQAMPGAEITRVLIAQFPKLPPPGQVRLLTALAERADPAAKPTVLAALKGGAPGVRAAALAALGKLGDESAVTVLAETAASGQGAEQAAARRSLYSLRGAGIDDAIIRAMGPATGKVKTELITAAGERGSTAAAGALADAAGATDPEIRRAALRALRTVGGAGQTQPLLDLLLKASSPQERRDATQTLAAVLRRSRPAPVGPVISAYQGATARPARVSLLEVLGQTSSDEALPLLRKGISDPDPEIARAAVLALSDWDHPGPLMDLLALARSAPRAEAGSEPAPGQRRPRGGPPPTGNLQVLAVRGVLKLLVLRSERTPEESAKLLSEAMTLSTQNAEKQAVLSLLSYFPSKESLDVAEAAMRDPAVANEAKIAFDQVNEALKLQ